jgi:hypothetical protein
MKREVKLCVGEGWVLGNLYTLACRQRISKLLQTRNNTILSSKHSTSSEIIVIERKYISDKKLVQEK